MPTLLIALFAISAAPLTNTDLARQLIVAFRPLPSPATEMSTEWSEDRRAVETLADRFGLTRVARLGDGLPAPLGTTSPASEGSHPTVDSSTWALAPPLDPARVWLLSAPDSAAAELALAALSHDPAVEWVERHALREPAVWRMSAALASRALDEPTDFPNDPLFRDGRQWGLENRGGPISGALGADVGARAAWGITAGAAHVLLAIADTGIDPAHPEFAGTMPNGSPRVLPGINLADGGADIRDLRGHGTPVAGIVAARTNDGAHFDSLGIAGVCGGDGATWPGCRLLPIKITSGSAGATGSFWIAGAILHSLHAGARAMNLSFAGSTPSRLERLALHEAVVRGMVVVVASGNRGFREGTAPQYPAAHAAEGLCLQVGASDPFDRRARFSSYGPGLDLVAPGENVWTTFMTYPSDAGGSHPGYVAASGTSFAAPFATGAVGLLTSVRPELTDTDAQQLLRATAADVGDPGPDLETGVGRLNLPSALRAVGPEIGIWHDEVPATVFRELHVDTLRVVEPGLGGISAGLIAPAVLIEATATVAVPDSFVDSIRVWTRVGGTTTLRRDFDLPYVVPWAEVATIEPGRFTLRGYLYRPLNAEGSGTDEGSVDELPLPSSQARFGFTVIGRVRRGLAAPSGSTASSMRAWPNPFVELVQVAGVEATRVWVLDVSGRRVRQLATGSRGSAMWDGRDERGRSLPAGLYWLAPRQDAGEGPTASPIRVLKLR